MTALPDPPHEDWVRVPCGGCTLCCKHSTDIFLSPDENPAEYESYLEHVDPLTGAETYRLKRDPSGDCVYLTPTGCGIHTLKPRYCRTFSCIQLYRSTRHLWPRSPEKPGSENFWPEPGFEEVFARGEQLSQPE